jgi:hypothetical protein
MSTDKGNVVMPMICPTDWMVPMAVRTLAARMGAPEESVVVANWAMKPELAMRFPFIPTAKASAGFFLSPGFSECIVIQLSSRRHAL